MFRRQITRTLSYSLKRANNNAANSAQTQAAKQKTMLGIASLGLIGFGIFGYTSYQSNIENIEKTISQQEINMKNDIKMEKLAKTEAGMEEILKNMEEQRQMASKNIVKAAFVESEEEKKEELVAEPVVEEAKVEETQVEESKVKETKVEAANFIEEILKNIEEQRQMAPKNIVKAAFAEGEEDKKEELIAEPVVEEAKVEETKVEEPKVEETKVEAAETAPEEPAAQDQPNQEDPNANPFKDAEIPESEQLTEHLNQEIQNQVLNEQSYQDQLTQLIQKTASSVKTAMSLQEMAATAIADHTKLVRVAMDDSSFSHEQRAENWALAAKGLEKRESARKNLVDPVREAKENLLEFRGFVNEMVEKYPGLKEEILRAEEWYAEMKKELESSTMQIAARLTEAEVMSNYSKMMQDARDEFHKELFDEATLPEDIAKIKEGWLAQADKPELDHAELNSLLAHAYHQINALKQELSTEREKINQKMQDAVSDERSQLLEEAEQKVRSETQSEFERLQALHNEKILEIRRKYEDETIMQLKRQTAAHISNMHDVTEKTRENTSEEVKNEYLKILDEVNADYAQKIENLLESHQNSTKNLIFEHESELEKANSIVQGIQGLFSDRSNLESTIEKSRLLSLAVKSLSEAIAKGNIALSNPIQKILNFGDDDGMVSDVVKNLIESNRNLEILDRGVHSEADLKSKFSEIIESCRTLQSVPTNQDISPIVRIFEKTKSKLQYQFALLPVSLAPPKEVCSENLSTSDYLAYATYCVENSDLEQAARFLNQIQNEKIGDITRDWIVEVCRRSEFSRGVVAIESISDAVSLALC